MRFVHWATAARPIDFMLCSVFMSSWQRIIDSAFAFTTICTDCTRTVYEDTRSLVHTEYVCVCGSSLMTLHNKCLHTLVLHQSSNRSSLASDFTSSHQFCSPGAGYRDNPRRLSLIGIKSGIVATLEREMTPSAMDWTSEESTSTWSSSRLGLFDFSALSWSTRSPSA